MQSAIFAMLGAKVVGRVPDGENAMSGLNLCGEGPAPSEPFSPHAIYDAGRDCLMVLLEDVPVEQVSAGPLLNLLRKEGPTGPIVGVQIRGFSELMEEPQEFVRRLEAGPPPAPTRRVNVNAAGGAEAGDDQQVLREHVAAIQAEVAARSPEQWTPNASYNWEGDQLEVYLEEGLYWGDQVGHTFVLYRADDDGRVVGIVISSMRFLCPKPRELFAELLARRSRG